MSLPRPDLGIYWIWAWGFRSETIQQQSPTHHVYSIVYHCIILYINEICQRRILPCKVTVMSLAGEIQGDCSTIARAFGVIATLFLQIRCFSKLGMANRAAASVSQGTSNLSFAAREEAPSWDIFLVFRSCPRVGGEWLFGCFWHMFLDHKPPESGCDIRKLSHSNTMAQSTKTCSSPVRWGAKIHRWLFLKQYIIFPYISCFAALGLVLMIFRSQLFFSFFSFLNF